MSEAQSLVALGRRAFERGEQVCLATVVHVEGSAYRKPGARMLLTTGGERTGTISGGCLEAEVSRKAWWLTENGPRLERYSSFADDDGGMPYGLGCGGTVSVLLERGEPVRAVLSALEGTWTSQQPAVLVMALAAARQPASVSPHPSRTIHERLGTLAVFAPVSTHRTGEGQPAAAPSNSHPPAPDVARQVLLSADQSPVASSSLAWMDGEAANQFRWKQVYAGETPLAAGLTQAVAQAFRRQRSCFLTESFAPLPMAPTPVDAKDNLLEPESEATELPAYLVEYVPVPPTLSIFGAGDDAQPIAELAHTLGWRVTVADGRAHLARADRFPSAAAVQVLHYNDPALRASCGIALGQQANSTEHTTGGRFSASSKPASFDEAGSVDCDSLAIVLTHSYEQDRALLATLLPRKLRYLGILGPRHRTERLLEEVCPAVGLSIEEGFARLHSPIGLDLGSKDPAAVALSIVAEVQAVLNHRQVAITRLQTGAWVANGTAVPAASMQVSREPAMQPAMGPSMEPFMEPAAEPSCPADDHG